MAIASLGAVEFVHYGTYNCRPIAGTSTLSQHAYANAIDIYGFTLDDGSFYTVIDDWEDFVDAPVTAGGSWLRGGGHAPVGALAGGTIGGRRQQGRQG